MFVVIKVDSILYNIVQARYFLQKKFIDWKNWFDPNNKCFQLIIQHQFNL